MADNGKFEWAEDPHLTIAWCGQRLDAMKRDARRLTRVIRAMNKLATRKDSWTQVEHDKFIRLVSEAYGTLPNGGF